MPGVGRFRRGHHARLRSRKSPEAYHDQRAEWRRRNSKRHARHVRCGKLKARYGMSCDEYDVLLAEQGGMCAICGGTNPSGHHLAVDHDHETGQVRGLLCHACNAGIGKLRDDPTLLRSAAAYLDSHN